MKRPRLIPLTLAVLVLAVAAQADDRGGRHRGPERDRGSEKAVAESGISLDQAVSMAERRYKARVVRTEVRTEGNRKVYVLRLLNDAGRVWTVKVDAQSGSIS